MKTHTCGIDLSIKRNAARMTPAGLYKPTCKCTGGGKQIAIVSCLKDMCIQCWRIYCRSRGWDLDLSDCANRIADQKGLCIKARGSITLDNIYDVLELSADVDCRHLSETRIRESIYMRNARNVNNANTNYSNDTDSDDMSETSDTETDCSTLSDRDFINDGNEQSDFDGDFIESDSQHSTEYSEYSSDDYSGGDYSSDDYSGGENSDECIDCSGHNSYECIDLCSDE
jgi:hypothetical protein